MPARPDRPLRADRRSQDGRSTNWGGLALQSLLKMSLARTRASRGGEAMPAEAFGALWRRAAAGEHDASIVGAQRGHRPAQRKDRLRLQSAGAARLPGQRRQRDDPLRLRLQLERLARTAVVHVRDPGDVRRVLHLQAQRACPGRDLLSVPLRARPALARPDRHAVLPDPGLPAAQLSVLAVLPCRPTRSAKCRAMPAA